MRSAAVTFVLLALVSIAVAADPAKPGKLKVGVTTVNAVDPDRSDRTLPTEIWYPAKTEGRDADPLPRAYPLILMAHGFCGSRLNYEYLTTHLASHGFMVAAPDFTGVTKEACDAGQVTVGADVLGPDLDFVCRLLHETTGPLAKYAQRVYGAPTGLVGHSLGGFGVVEAAKIDQFFTTVVALAPAEGADAGPPLADLTPRRAWMVMGGTADATISFTELTQPFFDGMPAPKYLVRYTGGTHSGFTDMDSGLGPEALAAQQTVVKRYATPFFFRYLAHKNKFGKRLRRFDDGTVALTAQAKRQ